MTWLGYRSLNALEMLTVSGYGLGDPPSMAWQVDAVAALTERPAAHGAGLESQINLPWGPFREGRPVAQFELSAQRQMEIDEAFQSAVFAVRSYTCPIGFKPWENAPGRSLRGIDPDGRIDPGGVWQPGTLQGADVQAHRHAYVTPANGTGNPSEAIYGTRPSDSGDDSR